jgi:hypothetical protein
MGLQMLKNIKPEQKERGARILGGGQLHYCELQLARKPSRAGPHVQESRICIFLPFGKSSHDARTHRKKNMTNV